MQDLRLVGHSNSWTWVVLNSLGVLAGRPHAETEIRGLERS